MISVVVPILNEASVIDTLLTDLQSMRARGHQVVVVDGGSSDNSVEIARKQADIVLQSRPGRAVQMNAGAEVSTGDVIWFVHADSRLPENPDMLIQSALGNGKRAWGRFNIRLSGRQALLRVVERGMNIRSRISGIATGDQGIFCSKQIFESIGGYTEIPLMEDIDFSRRLKASGWPSVIRQPLTTSSRRWEAAGILRTVLTMWKLRLAYFFGADPARLARQYGYTL